MDLREGSNDAPRGGARIVAAAASVTVAASTLRFDESADFCRRSEDDVGAVAHHPGAYECRRSRLWTVAAAVSLEPKIALPKSMHLPVGGGHAIGVAAIADC